MVLKLLESTQGKGVVLAETYTAAESLIDAFRDLDAHFLVQVFIREAGGADIRCLVIGVCSCCKPLSCKRQQVLVLI